MANAQAQTEDIELQPKTGTPAVPASETPSSPSELPKELVQMPIMQALMAGKPPAVSTSIKRPDPAAETLWKEREKVMPMGIAFYRSLSNNTAVIFNQLYLSPVAVKKADAEGRIAEIALPVPQVEGALAANPQANPVLQPANVPKALPGAPTPLLRQTGNPPQTPVAAPNPTGNVPAPLSPPAPAGLQNRIGSARLNALKPKGPATGMKPGAGRLLNQLIQPVV